MSPYAPKYAPIENCWARTLAELEAIEKMPSDMWAESLSFPAHPEHFDEAMLIIVRATIWRPFALYGWIGVRSESHQWEGEVGPHFRDPHNRCAFQAWKALRFRTEGRPPVAELHNRIGGAFAELQSLLRAAPGELLN